MNIEVAYLDRDGTINVELHYLSSAGEFRFCQGAIEGLKLLSSLGISLIVVTNQSGISRGYLDTRILGSIHDHMTSELARHGVRLEAIYYCPHGPDDECSCRKPLPGMIQLAEAEHGRRKGVIIGDSSRDIEAGRAAGVELAVLIDPKSSTLHHEAHADYTARNLSEAASWVATQMGEPE